MNTNQNLNHQKTAEPALDACVFFSRMDYGEKLTLAVDLFDIITDFIFFTTIGSEESLRWAVLICASLGLFVVMAKLVWLRRAYALHYDAWDITQGVINLGYCTLILEDIPQLVFVLAISASKMERVGQIQLGVTCVAIIWKCLQDILLAFNCLARDLTGKRKTNCQFLWEKMCGETCIPNHAEKQRAKNENDIEDGGNILPSSSNTKDTFKHTDVALLTARPLLYNGSPLNLETNARQVTDRLKDTFMKVIAQTERTFTFAHYTGSLNNFQRACVDNAQVIHYSGTAVEGKLALESDPSIGIPGQMTLVDGDFLKACIKKNSCKLAFVASPAPRFAGQVFVDAGVDHVVCIYSVELKDQTIESQAAANVFTATFYNALVSGVSVAKAYDTANANTKNYPGYNADNFMLLPQSGGASFHDVVLFDASAETSREGFQDRSETPQVKNITYNDDGVLGKEQRVADMIPAVMKSSVNVLVGSDIDDNISLMMAASNYLVERYCFNKGAHFLKFSPLQADPATYCLDVFIARRVLGKDSVPSDNAKRMVLDWLRELDSNDSVGLVNCVLLCCDGLRPLLIDTQFDEHSAYGFITEEVRKRNLNFLKELMSIRSGLKILACSPSQDVLNLLLDNDVPSVNPKAIMVKKSVQPSESLHL